MCLVAYSSSKASLLIAAVFAFERKASSIHLLADIARDHHLFHVLLLFAAIVLMCQYK